jgi:hypothetical protein
MKVWSSASAARLPEIAARRVKNLGRLATTVFSATGRELSAAFDAWRDGRFGNHFGNRTAAAIDGSVAITKNVAAVVGTVGKGLLSDPKRNAPDVFALAMGFYVGGGGLDGNGGIPDTDLALGIGWHRSLFTHSIIAGTVAEGAILALADLASVVVEKLPTNQRDQFWDRLVSAKDRIAQQLAVGTSAGIAYHLAVDATLQPAPYHDLPFSMPMEGHQTLMAANAAAEGVDVFHKKDEETTVGKRTVAAVTDFCSGVAKAYREEKNKPSRNPELQWYREQARLLKK